MYDAAKIQKKERINALLMEKSSPYIINASGDAL